MNNLEINISSLKEFITHLSLSLSLTLSLSLSLSRSLPHSPIIHPTIVTLLIHTFFFSLPFSLSFTLDTKHHYTHYTYAAKHLRLSYNIYNINSTGIAHSLALHQIIRMTIFASSEAGRAPPTPSSPMSAGAQLALLASTIGGCWACFCCTSWYWDTSLLSLRVAERWHASGCSFVIC